MVDTLEDPDPMMMQAEMDNNNNGHSDNRRKEVVKALTNPPAEAKPLSSERSRQQSRRNEAPQLNGDEEDGLVCGRFPHMQICACDIQCSIALSEINLFEVYPGIVMGPYQAAFKTKQLIEMGVTHIVNATCREYTKREKHFKYLDIQIYDTHAEDAKKNFRITNRFIDEARKNQCKVLV